MKFTTLAINNFLTIGSAKLRLADKGLNLLRGVNEDDSSALSNGSGKSSIADALCWCLFGETARGESGDSVVNQSAKKDCRVVVEFEDGDIVYIVERFRKHSTHKNDLQLSFRSAVGGTGSLTKGTVAETQAEIIKALGCTHEVFVASIYAGQEAMPDLPALTDKPLKLLIEQASGSERLEKAYAIARARVVGAQAQVSAAAVEQQRINARTQEVARDIERSKLLHGQFEQQREVRVNEVAAKRAQQEKEVSDKKAQLQSLASGLDALKQERADIHAKLQGVNTLQAEIDGFRNSVVTPLYRQIEVAKAEVTRKTGEAQKLRGEHDNVVSKVGKPCGECGKPTTEDDVGPLRAILRNKLVTLIGDIQKLQGDLAPLETEFHQKNARLAELSSKLPDVPALTARSSAIDREIQAMQNLGVQIGVLQNQFIDVQAEQDKIRSEANPYQTVIDDLVKKAHEVIAQGATAKSASADAETELEVAQQVAQVFGPAGVRAHILDTVTPFLNERTSEYLSVLSDGQISAVWSTLTRNAKGEAKEKFAIEVEHRQGGKKYGLLSGGEKRKVRLATMLALQDLVAARASKPIQLWIGDEIDDALDANGLERLMGILERKAREKGTVLVISHNELRDWIDDTTVVTKKGGVSTVEGSLVAA